MKHLSSNERLDKPFTHAEYNLQDLFYLEHMRQELPNILHELAGNAGEQNGFTSTGRAYRVITTNKAALLAAPTLHVVGFCGNRVPNISSTLLAEMDVVDGDLVAELAQHDQIVCYAGIHTDCNNWRNLVVMLSEAGVQHWRESTRHIYAAEMLSPKYYTHVRLHNGVLRNGLASVNIELLHTKYFDFASGDDFRAMRPAGNV